MLVVNDGHRIARDPAAASTSTYTTSTCTAFEVFGVERIHVNVEPIVVVEVAMSIRGHGASEMFALVVYICGRVDDAQQRNF